MEWVHMRSGLSAILITDKVKKDNPRGFWCIICDESKDDYDDANGCKRKIGVTFGVNRVHTFSDDININ